MSHWNGKLWYAYGTSMTSVAQGKYVPVVERLSGLKAVNFGIPGGCISPDGYGRGNVKSVVMRTFDGKDKADLITLEVLPNEGDRVGSIYDTDDESVCGCLNQCLRYLQENTRAQIVLIIMIGGNVRPPENVIAGRGITQFEFAETLERVGRLNSVPVINAFTDSGFGYARVKDHGYQHDSIHLNDLGGLNMGEFIWSRLKDIPLWHGEL